MQHFSLTQADANSKTIFENVDASTKFLEQKQAEQEQVNQRLTANLEQAGAAIGKMNNSIQGLARSQVAMGTTLTSLAAQLNQLTTQLQQVLSQKADIPTTTNKDLDEPNSKKGRQQPADGEDETQQS